MDQLRVRDHIIHVTQNEVKLRDLKGGQLALQPADITEVRELVGALWKMTSLPALPDTIQSPSGVFTAFIKGKEVQLRRSEDVAGNEGFRFPLNECDFVIDAIDMGLNKLKDLFALNPQPRANGVQATPLGFDMFEGRN
jgi:hypothetical protein